MAKSKRKLYKGCVIESFKKRSRDGTIKQYKVGDTYSTTHSDSIEYLKLIKKIK